MCRILVHISYENGRRRYRVFFDREIALVSIVSMNLSAAAAAADKAARSLLYRQISSMSAEEFQ